MNAKQHLESDNGLEVAKRMAEEEEGVARRPAGGARFIIQTSSPVRSLLTSRSSHGFHPNTSL